jgi:PAS domain-containing protein
MNKIVAFLAKLGYWPFVVLFTFLTIVASELLVVLHSYWLTGLFFDENMLIAGLTIPIVDGFIVYGLVAFLIRNFHELENEKNTIFNLHQDIQKNLNYERMCALQYLDITGTIIIALDTHGNIVLANKTLYETLGFTSENTLIGKNWFEEFLPQSSKM